MQQLIDESLEKIFNQSDSFINQSSSTDLNNNAISEKSNSSEEQFNLNSPIVKSVNYLFYPSEQSYNEDFQEFFLGKKSNEEIPINKNENENEKEKEKENVNLFKCDFCAKSYLSQAALYTHCKNKHNYVKKVITKNGKQRGRPRKEELPLDEKIYLDPKSIGYFLKNSRAGNVLNGDFEKCVENAFKKLFINKKNKNYEKIIKCDYENFNDVAFLKKFNEDLHDKYKIIVNEQENIDKIFISYLNRVSLYCNPDYYINIICFVTLFRNFIEIKKNENETNFCEENEIEDIPFLSNEFINIFFNEQKSDNFFELSSNEAIELMQNLCYWLYENNYTTAKLSLISEEKK